MICRLRAADALLADYRARDLQASGDEETIQGMMRKGLSREQAVACIKKNRDFRLSRFMQIGDAEKIRALFPDATDEEILAATKTKTA